MNSGIRVAIASSGPDQFKLLNRVVRYLGHNPAVYLMSRSMRPNMPSEPDVLSGVTGTVMRLPSDVGLLLPSGTVDLRSMLSGYNLDLLIVFGFNWRIPAEVIHMPRLGTLNVHPSLLPELRGPSPVPWAIRNGHAELGVTVHRMTEAIDAGPVLAQGTVGQIPEVVSPADIWNLIEEGLSELLEQAFSMALAGDEGIPQVDELASYAGFPPPEWNEVSWDQPRMGAHHQVRAYRFLHRGAGPVVEVTGRQIRILRTSSTEQEGLVVHCADGPLWITEYEVNP